MEGEGGLAGCFEARPTDRPRVMQVATILRRLGPATMACLALLASAPAGAQTYEGPRLLGLAEAQRALATGNDAIYVNPAGLALAQIYSIELGYLDDLLGSDRRFNASVVDGQSGPVAGGVAYTYTKRAPDAAEGGDARLEGHRTEMSLATRIADTAAIGLTARYVTFERSSGQEDLPDDDFKSFQIDAGFQWRIWQGLSVGVAGYNLTKSEREELPIAWGAGVGYQAEWFSLEADIRYNAQKGKPRYSVAGSFVIAELIPVRFGTSYDHATKGWSISMGSGFVIDRFGMDIGYRQRLKGDDLLEYGDERILGIAMRLMLF